MNGIACDDDRVIDRDRSYDGGCGEGQTLILDVDRRDKQSKVAKIALKIVK